MKDQLVFGNFVGASYQRNVFWSMHGGKFIFRQNKSGNPWDGENIVRSFFRRNITAFRLQLTWSPVRRLTSVLTSVCLVLYHARGLYVLACVAHSRSLLFDRTNLSVPRCDLPSYVASYLCHFQLIRHARLLAFSLSQVSALKSDWIYV